MYMCIYSVLIEDLVVADLHLSCLFIVTYNDVCCSTSLIWRFLPGLFVSHASLIYQLGNFSLSSISHASLSLCHVLDHFWLCIQTVLGVCFHRNLANISYLTYVVKPVSVNQSVQCLHIIIIY